MKLHNPTSIEGSERNVKMENEIEAKRSQNKREIITAIFGLYVNPKHIIAVYGTEIRFDPKSEENTYLFRTIFIGGYDYYSIEFYSEEECKKAIDDLISFI